MVIRLPHIREAVFDRLSRHSATLIAATKAADLLGRLWDKLCLHRLDLLPQPHSCIWHSSGGSSLSILKYSCLTASITFLSGTKCISTSTSTLQVVDYKLYSQKKSRLEVDSCHRSYFRRD